MNKTQLSILERAFAAETDPDSPGLINSWSETTKRLARDGYLAFESVRLKGFVELAGYRITSAGVSVINSVQSHRVKP
ncbi:hypothetical protein [Erwinia endophytica]|uniref:hypothetical protein n=1 Tax=Erwinia endophytica TaxID=1563158 RepID=UPI001265ED15|nr:hypothetical protein [Erwinia endophytica]